MISLLLARKDLLVLFRSPLAFVVLTCFLVVSGYFFVSSVAYFQLVSIQLAQNPDAATISAQELLITPYLQNTGIILLFFMPLMTMRGFAEEKRMGTFELLMSYPLSEAQLVMGKLVSLAVFIACTLVFSIVSPAMLFLYTTPEIPPLLAGYLGLFLMALSFASLGIFLSTLTENQIVSAVLSFAALLLLWLITWVKESAPAGLKPLIEGLSLMTHFAPFTKGVIVFADLVYYLAFIAAFIWLSVLSLENQRWRR